MTTVEETALALRFDQIQANALPGFGADHQTLLALRIHDADAARNWLRTLVAVVTTSEEMRDAGREDGGPWINVALSHEGLRLLLGADPGFRDQAFRAGLAARSAILGDPRNVPDWVVGGPTTPLHLLVIVAGRDGETVTHRVDTLSEGAADSGLAEVWREGGFRLRDADNRAIEHFGFRDDVSQPAVRGVEPTRTGRSGIAPSATPAPLDGPEYATPGAPLIWPGSFVFGYPAQNPNDPVRAGVPVDAGPAWAADGSFLVFRRLTQDYAGFWGFLDNAGRRLGMSAEAVGALVVGRWKSGAPVIRTAHRQSAGPGSDDPRLGGNRDESNDFDFSNPPAKGGAYEDGQDPLGLACPASAHIRKVNPRAGYTDQGGQEDTLTRRVLRRGIPYGPLFDDAPEQERGLHFLCYQTSIVDQFEFLTRIWSNSPAAPRGGGLDLAVGQHGDPTRTAFLTRPGGAHATVPVSAGMPFVVATGGEYLFAPSKDGLRYIVDPAPA